MEPLGDLLSLDRPGGDCATAAAAEAGGRSRSTNINPLQKNAAIEGLEKLTAADPSLALPSAQEVWSPILALRTFVEPLTSRASAAFRNFQVSFHDPEGEAAGAGGGGDGSRGSGSLEGGGREEKATTVAAVAVAVSAGDEEQGGDGAARRDGHRERQSTTAGGGAATEELRGASAEHFGPPESGEVALAVVSSGHDRTEAAMVVAGQEEKCIGTAEMKDDDDGYGCRVAV